MKQPIFIHSLFRSGSTYLFNVFRQKSGSYYCYQEPDHEVIDNINDNPDALLNFNNKSLNALRHPNLEKPYFYELYAFQNQLKGLFDTSISFEGFFPKTSNLPANQKKYFSALINLAPAQPVLQLCRSYGRIEQLKNAFAGVHIHLWREPRSQWWSYLVDPYFEYTFEKILAAKNLPAFFSLLIKKEQQITANSFEQKYYRFFFFWTYSYIQNLKHSDIDLCIDMVSADQDHKKNIINQLSLHHISNIHLDDCCSPYTQLSYQEADNYDKIEAAVLDVFAHLNPEFKSFTLQIRTQLSELRKKLDCPEAISPEEKKYRSVALSFMETSSATNHLYLKQKNAHELQALQTNTECSSLKLQIKQMEAVFNSELKNRVQELDNAKKQLDAIRSQAILCETNFINSEIHLLETTKALSLANQHIAEIHNSCSWKLSKPLRLIGSLVSSSTRSSKNIAHFLPNGRKWLKIFLKKTLKRIGQAAIKNIWIKNKALGYLYSRPTLKAKLRFLILAQNFSSPSTAASMTITDKNVIEKELSTPTVLVKMQNPNAINAKNKTPLEAYYY